MMALMGVFLASALSIIFWKLGLFSSPPLTASWNHSVMLTPLASAQARMADFWASIEIPFAT